MGCLNFQSKEADSVYLSVPFNLFYTLLGGVYLRITPKVFPMYILLGSVYLKVIFNLSCTLLVSVYLKVTFNHFYIYPLG